MPGTLLRIVLPSVSPWLVSNAFRFFGHFDLRKFNHRGTARLTAATNEDG